MNKRNWIITGVSSGIGKALAIAVLETGDSVIGTFRNEDQATSFSESHKNAEGLIMDLSDSITITEFVKSVNKKYDSIDVLVNNAGVGFAGAIEEASIDEVKTVFEVNVFGTLLLTQLVLPIMRSQGKGHIVQISSHAGVKAFAGFGIYNSSKFALEGFSEAMAQEIKPLGINVTIVEPGPFRTNFAGNSLLLADKEIAAYADSAGAFRKKLLSVHNKQEGHPTKAAKAIINHVEAKEPSLRLPLGKIPIITIGMKIKSLQEDLEANRQIAESAVYID